MKKKILCYMLLIIISIVTLISPVYASSYQNDYDYYDGIGYNSYDRQNPSKSLWKLAGEFVLVLVIIFIVPIIRNIKRSRKHSLSISNDESMSSGDIFSLVEQRKLIDRIRISDNTFNELDFISWVRNLFIKYQEAWSDRDWSAMRCYETVELYEIHSAQINDYIENKVINKIERVNVNWVKFYDFIQANDKEFLSVIISSQMLDYIIKEDTGRLLKGDKDISNVNLFKLTFVRRKLLDNQNNYNNIKTTNCPNCGAPTEVTSSGKCSYCGSIITKNDYDWVLSGYEKFNNSI